MREQFTSLVEQTAELLDGDWKISPGICAWKTLRLTGPDGEAILIVDGDESHRSTEHGRLLISAGNSEFHGNLSSREYPDSITVTQTRGPQWAAQSITSRLLPALREALAAARQRQAARDVANAAARARHDRLARAAGGESFYGHRDTEVPSAVHAANVSITRDYRDRWDFTVSEVPDHRADHLAALIRNFFGAEQHERRAA